MCRLGGVDEGGALLLLVADAGRAQALAGGDERARGAHLRGEVGDALGVHLVVVDSRAAVGDLGRVRDRRVDGVPRRVDEASRNGDGVDPRAPSAAGHERAPFAVRARRPLGTPAPAVTARWA